MITVAKTIRLLICALFAMWALFMAINSFLFTCYINPLETTDYLTDTPWAHLLCLALLLALGVYMMQRQKSFTEAEWKRVTRVVALVMLIGLVVCVLISHPTPFFDNWIFMRAARLTRQGNYLDYSPNKYLGKLQHQLNFVLFILPFSVLPTASYALALQFVNVIAILTMVWALANGAAACCKDANTKARTEAFICIAAFLFLPIWLYSTFVYGTLIGAAFFLLGARQLMLYLQDRKNKRVLWMGLFILLACLLKKNYFISMIAACVILLLDALRTRRARSLLTSLCIAAVCLTINTPIIRVMEKITGGDLSEGFPTSVWILQGLQEGDRSPGWYNESGFDIYYAAGNKRDVADEMAKAEIRERLSEFAADPLGAVSFFYRKTVSQWNEPSNQSLWINEMMRTPERSPIVLSLYERGKLGRAVLWWMDQYHCLLYIGVALWVIFRMKKASLSELLLPLVYIGGFLFHLVWEGKSQYTLVYTFYLIPSCVSGYVAFLKQITNRLIAKRQAKPSATIDVE